MPIRAEKALPHQAGFDQNVLSGPESRLRSFHPRAKRVGVGLRHCFQQRLEGLACSAPFDASLLGMEGRVLAFEKQKGRAAQPPIWEPHLARRIIVGLQRRDL
jgi:hypothetical protein